MTKQKQQVSEEDNETISGSNKRSTASGEEETDYFDSLTIDLVINIMSKLPFKSKALCRCVSKQRSSILRSPNYNQLFPIKSPAQPRLLFFFSIEENFLYYSSPQPQNPDENSSVLATLHLSIPSPSFYELCPPLHGLICQLHSETYKSVVMVSNLITREYVTLPKLIEEGGSRNKKYYFGYDPIHKQFKVLAITWFRNVAREYSTKYQILTLGTGNLSWRQINGCTDHYPLNRLDYGKGICIEGVLYYRAGIINYYEPTHASYNRGYHPPEDGIVCFDVRSEKFSLIRINDQDMKVIFQKQSTLINHMEKLGVIIHDYDYNAFKLWVLEDAKKPKWSKHIYQISRPSLNPGSYLCCAGMISSGIIAFYESLAYPGSYPYFIYYYNLEKKTITSVRIEVPGLKEYHYARIHTFSNFVEDVKLM